MQRPIFWITCCDSQHVCHQIHTERETCLVCIFGINVVLDSIAALLVEIFGCDLDKVRNFCLGSKSDCHVLKFCNGDFLIYQDEHCDLVQEAVLLLRSKTRRISESSVAGQNHTQACEFNP